MKSNGKSRLTENETVASSQEKNMVTTASTSGYTNMAPLGMAGLTRPILRGAFSNQDHRQSRWLTEPIVKRRIRTFLIIFSRSAMQNEP